MIAEPFDYGQRLFSRILFRTHDIIWFFSKNFFDDFYLSQHIKYWKIKSTFSNHSMGAKNPQILFYQFYKKN